MYIQDVDTKLKDWDFKQRYLLPYDIKLNLTETRIIDFNRRVDTYISFSGGLDSTLVLHLVRKHIGEHIPAVFVDTGLEIPEIRNWVKRCEEIYGNIIILKPKLSHQEILSKYGYPFVSKETAAKIRKLRHGNLSERYRNYLINGDERGKLGRCPVKWQHLADKDFPVEVSEKCCNFLKESPLISYQRQTGRYPYIGITQDESFMRRRQYERTGCLVLEGGKIQCKPLGFWNKNDVLRYYVENRLEYCPIYGDIVLNAKGEYITTGEQRTGCMYCLFGIHLEQEPNRIQRLHETHPDIYEYIMRGGDIGEDGVIRPTPKYGLGYRKLQEPLGINLEPMAQTSLFDGS
ncbi:MAG: aminotransferase V [Ruminococcaceae bacterium]|nr:aminotransferase V [Oscillospiraceae bacterium]